MLLTMMRLGVGVAGICLRIKERRVKRREYVRGSVKREKRSVHYGVHVGRRSIDANERRFFLFVSRVVGERGSKEESKYLDVGPVGHFEYVLCVG